MEEQSDVQDKEFNTCFACNGSGVKKKKEKLIDKKILKEVECNTCGGKGVIERNKRKTAEGKWRKKKISKSYVNFVAPGPFPRGENGETDLAQQEDEELSYLAGNWRIFQKLDRHRYSTDDIVTSWIACNLAKSYGMDDVDMIDIGCGLGSVLLTNAWQMPSARLIGVEAQEDRFTQAKRSIRYNIGDSDRVTVVNQDLRSLTAETFTSFGFTSFDVVTGTPPYFPPQQLGKPGCFESAGCLFELRGGVEEYCLSASRLLRQPTSIQSVQEREIPSFLVLCNTSLASSRVYAGCVAANISVIKRIDVIPKIGKPALFSVFIIVSNEWIARDEGSLEPKFPSLTPPVPFQSEPAQGRRVEGSLRGEEVQEFVVRDGVGAHTMEYQKLLSDLGKPSSADRESYSLDNIP